MFKNTLKQISPRRFDQLQILKPVGVAAKPVRTDGLETRPLSQRFKDWLDNDNRLKRKAALEKEFATSGMYDMFVYRKTEGKVFLAPKSYFRSDKARYFPNFIADRCVGTKAKNVATCDTLNSGKISIVRLLHSAISQKLTRTFLKSDYGAETSFLDSSDEFARFTELYPETQIVSLHFFDSWINRKIFATFAAPKLLQNSAFLNKYYLLKSSRLTSDVRDSINHVNNITGYTYVVDGAGKIRWLSSGAATESEFAAMWRCIEGLRQEQKSQQ